MLQVIRTINEPYSVDKYGHLKVGDDMVFSAVDGRLVGMSTRIADRLGGNQNNQDEIRVELGPNFYAALPRDSAGNIRIGDNHFSSETGRLVGQRVFPGEPSSGYNSSAPSAIPLANLVGHKSEGVATRPCRQGAVSYQGENGNNPSGSSTVSSGSAFGISGPALR